jgi:hypothetical protein
MKQHSFTGKHLWKQLRIYFIGRWNLLLGILLVMAAGLTLEVLAVSIDHAVERWIDGESIKAGHWWFIVICSALVFILSGVIWFEQHVFRSLWVRYSIKSDAMPKPYLVIFISRQDCLKNLADIPEDGKLSLADIKLERKNLLDEAELIGRSLEKQWSWEMILRAIHPHLSVLKRIYLIGSKESQGKEGLEPGTFAQKEMLCRFLAPYLVAAGKAATPSGAASMIVSWSKPVDFESFEDVHQTLESIRNELAEELNEEDELCVDITGGQKPTSAAAGLFTVNKGVVIQYVQTNPPKKPQMYDVRLLEWPKRAD